VLDPGPAPVLSDDSPKVSAERPSYEHAKLEAEYILLAACPASVALRPTVVYGPWGRDWTELPLRRLEAGESGLPSGPGYGLSNAIYVDDLVEAIVSACESSCSGPILIAGDERVEWGLFYDSYRAVLGLATATHDATPLPAWESQLYGQAARADLTRAERLLGYRPQVSFAAGMAHVASWRRWMTGASGWADERSPEPRR
jgi:nucleoside-diphosphate-sugar epimerase